MVNVLRAAQWIEKRASQRGDEGKPSRFSHGNRARANQRKVLHTRKLHLEHLEERALLSVAPAEYGAILEHYSNIALSSDMNQVNIIELTDLTAAALQNAVNESARTTMDDLIVVRTTDTDHTIMLEGNPISVAVDSELFGSVAIVSLSYQRETGDLLIDTQSISRGFRVSQNSDLFLGGMEISGTTWSFDEGNEYGGLIFARNNSSVTLSDVAFNVLGVDEITRRDAENTIAALGLPDSPEIDYLLSLPDAFVMDPVAGAGGMKSPTNAGVQEGTEVMIGNVWVTLVLMESNGNDENWTVDEVSNVKREVRAGLDWWETAFDIFNPNSPVDLEFTIDYTHADTRVATSREPIQMPSTGDYLWENDFLTLVGFAPSSVNQSSVLSKLQEYNNYKRETVTSVDVDWAFTVFVVDSSADEDGKFPDGFFGYAYSGGPNVVMTYDNNGWGIDNMESVLAHEVGHIFNALDEYSVRTSYGDTAASASYNLYGGYYGIQNTNATDDRPADAPPQVNSIMGIEQQVAYANMEISQPARETIGWRDTDNDGVIDYLDLPLTLTNYSGKYDTELQLFRFSATSTVAMMDNWMNNRRDTSLNTVDRLQYQLDDGPWITLATMYGGATANVSTDITALGIGDHHISFRTLCERTWITSGDVSWDFSVEGRELLAPTISVSATGLDAISVTIGAVSLASGYFLEYSSDPGFSTATAVTYNSAGTYSIGGLSEGTTYYFRVKAIGAGAIIDSPWSETVSVATKKVSKLTIPEEIVAVRNDSSSINVKWKEVEEASGYLLEYSTSPRFAKQVEQIECAANETDKTIFNLTTNTTYFFRVQAIGDGEYESDSEWSSPVYATTQAVLSTPLIENVSVLGCTSVAFELIAPQGSKSILVQYYPLAQGGTSTDFDENNSGIKTETQYVSAFTVRGLAPNTAYRFRFKAASIVSQAADSEWTAATDCVTSAKLDSPLITSLNASGLDAIDVVWSKTELTAQYTLRYRPQSEGNAGSWTEKTFASTVLNDTVNELESNTLYEFQVRAGNGVQDPSDWSDVKSVTTFADMEVRLDSNFIPPGYEAGDVVAIFVKTDCRVFRMAPDSDNNDNEWFTIFKEPAADDDPETDVYYLAAAAGLSEGVYSIEVFGAETTPGLGSDPAQRLTITVYRPVVQPESDSVETESGILFTLTAERLDSTETTVEYYWVDANDKVIMTGENPEFVSYDLRDISYLSDEEGGYYKPLYLYAEDEYGIRSEKEMVKVYIKENIAVEARGESPSFVGNSHIYKVNVKTNTCIAQWVVHWGDETSTKVNVRSNNMSFVHYYAEPGSYQVSLEFVSVNGKTSCLRLETYTFTVPEDSGNDNPAASSGSVVVEEAPLAAVEVERDVVVEDVPTRVDSGFSSSFTVLPEVKAITGLPAESNQNGVGIVLLDDVNRSGSNDRNAGLDERVLEFVHQKYKRNGINMGLASVDSYFTNFEDENLV